MSKPGPSRWSSTQVTGVAAALLSALASGFVPIFGKLAYEAGLEPFTVVMLRTVGAAALLWGFYLVFARKSIFIYPFAFWACVIAGVVNGLGSLLFYTSLKDLNASISQLLFTLYPIFLTLFSWLDGYRLSRLTLVRLALALLAVFLLKWSDPSGANWGAALLMIGSGALYALHIALNQHTLYDVPSPTVTLYTLSGMAGTVFVAYLVGGRPALPDSAGAWQPVLLLTLVTVAARLTLFVGVKHLGGMQTILLNLSESFVTIVAAGLLLNEALTPLQWLGAGLLAVSLLLVTREQTLGAIPRPKPWLLLFTTWFEAVRPQLPRARRAAERKPSAPPRTMGEE